MPRRLWASHKRAHRRTPHSLGGPAREERWARTSGSVGPRGPAPHSHYTGVLVNAYTTPNIESAALQNHYGRPSKSSSWSKRSYV